MLDTISIEQVILVAHIPPGQFEKHANYKWFYDYYNEVFISLLKKHEGTIGSTHMGHHHTDSFRVVYADDGERIFFSASAVATSVLSSIS